MALTQATVFGTGKKLLLNLQLKTYLPTQKKIWKMNIDDQRKFNNDEF